MVFVERNKRGKHTYYYLAKSYREDGKVKKKRVFLGADLDSALLQEKISEAMAKLDEIDFGSVISKNEAKEFDELGKELNNAISGIEPNNFYEHFITQYTYDSNAMEGSTLTLRETGLVLFDKISPQSKPLRDVKEAENHKKAFDYMNSLKTQKLSQETVCKIQELIVKDTLSESMKQFEGTLRGVNVRVGNHIAPPFYKVPKQLENLLRWHSKYHKKFHPVVIAAYFHAEFETIHPFVDGNGRTGRLLMNYMLKQSNYPPINIFLKYRLKYYEALEKARKEKNLKPLIKIMKNCYKDMIKIYKAEK